MRMYVLVTIKMATNAKVANACDEVIALASEGATLTKKLDLYLVSNLLELNSFKMLLKFVFMNNLVILPIWIQFSFYL